MIDDDAQHPDRDQRGGPSRKEAIPAGECYVFDVLAPLERLELPGRRRESAGRRRTTTATCASRVSQEIGRDCETLGSRARTDAADDATSTGGGSAGSARDVTVFFTSDCILLDPATSRR